MPEDEKPEDKPASNDSVPAGLKYAVDQIKEIAEGPASSEWRYWVSCCLQNTVHNSC